MPLRNTSIHSALGETGDLTYSMIEAAVARGVREDSRLDWKQGLYEGDKGKAEFQKDVAALANAQGGVIVIGVAEERLTGAAKKVMPITARDDRLERQMRSWLHNAVSPVVNGVEFLPLTKDDGDNDGVLVVHVPPSANTPHMIGSDKSLGFPYRDGTQTRWMKEPDLERLYRQRFDRRASDEAQLDTLIDRATRHLDLRTAPWVVVAARPTILRSATLTRPTKDEVVAVLRGALGLRRSLKVSDRFATPIQSLDSDILNPRTGLRSWIATYRKQNLPSDKAAWAYIAIYDDGSVVLAGQSGHFKTPVTTDRNEIHEGVIVGVAIDLLCLLDSTAKSLGVDSEYLARVGLAKWDSSPFAYVAPERIGGVTLGIRQVPWSLDVDEYERVDLVVPPRLDADTFQASVGEVANQIAAQFGVTPFTI